MYEYKCFSRVMKNLFLQEEAMDFKVNREIFSTKEVVYDGNNEQAVELDYILPDYFPEIFKVLKCQLSPRIVSHSISGEKLTYELVVGIKVLYMSEGSNALRSIEQKLNYTKTANLGTQADKMQVIILPKADYINCRVVNQRRLDFRGAISCKIKVVGEKKQQIVSDAFGGNIQLKKETVSYPTNRLTATKRATIIEDLDMGAVKPAIISIARSDADITSNEHKIITNKLITKGEANINILYICENENGDGLDTMQFTVPFSQVIDMDGINEKYDAMVNINVISCEIIPHGTSGESREVECEINLEINCVANKYENVDIVSDAFSTTHPVNFEYIDAKIEKKPAPINLSQTIKSNLEYKEGDIASVYDAWVKVNSVMSRMDIPTNTMYFTGVCNFVVIAKNEDGKPVYIENDMPFETAMQIENDGNDSYAEPKATVVSNSYNLTSANTVEVKAEINIGGYINEAENNKLVSNIEVDETVKKEHEGDYALKLYFADNGEDVWEIAKKYSTSIKAVMDENDLTEDKMAKKGMLLIPMVD